MIAIKNVLLDLPRRIQAFRDPLRRRNLAGRIAETLIPTFLVLWVGVTGEWMLSLRWAGGVVLGEFLLYEFLLEPLGWSGHYWERGPRDGESFTIW